MNHPQAEVNTQANEIEIKEAFRYSASVLSRREYSVKGIELKLMQKGHSKEVIERTLNKLVSEGWLSEKRFCESFLRYKIRKGCGKSKIVYELKQQGISKALIDDAFAEESPDWFEIGLKEATKKWNQLGSADIISKESKLTRFLNYRGFDSEIIKYSIEVVKKNLGESSGDYDQQ